jgi:hypothetical protein
MDIRICQKKCAIKYDCEDFLSAVKAPVVKTPTVENDLPAPLGARPVAVGPG